MSRRTVIAGSALAAAIDAAEDGGGHQLEDRLGRCYELAARTALRGGRALIVVHGDIQGAAHPPVNHAWVEAAGGQVIDPVLLRGYTTDEHAAAMNAVTYCRHTADEVARILRFMGHWGPWEGFCDTRARPVGAA